MSEALRTENRGGDTFTDRTRGIVIALAVVSLFATIGVLVFGRDLASPPAQPRDSYGRGPLGHRAFVETMQALGVHVVRWTRSDYTAVSAPLFVIEPDQPEYTTSDGRRVSLAELCETRSAAGRMTVVVLPKWQFGALGNATPEDAWRVRQVLAGTPFGTAQMIWQRRISSDRETITATSATLGERHLEIPWPQTIVGATPLLSGPTGAFIAADATGRTLLISDPDILHNFDIQRADHAAVLRALVSDVLHADTIVVDEVFHEHVETRSLAQIFSHFPGVLALLHGALVILVVLLYGRRRFGPPQLEPTAYGRGPREVIDVAAGVLASGQSVERLAPRYVEQVILDAHRRAGRPEGKTLAQKAAVLDAMLTRRGLLPDAVRLLETSQHATRDTALGIAKRATQLRESLLGAATKEPPRTRPVSIPPPPPAAAATNDATPPTHSP